MNQNRPPTLEELRQTSVPAWLWDAARARIVWANAAGVSAFGAESVFDLVDRPFDPQEAGVRQLLDQAQTLHVGQQETVDLPFPSIAPGLTVSGRCSLHLLADGRQGILLVANPIQQATSDMPQELASAALANLPLALLLIDATGVIQHSNAAARALLPPAKLHHLRDAFADASQANAMLQRLGGADITSSVATIVGVLGPREVRFTLSRLPGEKHLSVMMEDVTDRRALERGLQVAEPAPALAPKSAQDAFAQLARSLQETIGSTADKSPSKSTETVGKPIAGPAAETASKKAPATRPPAVAPFVPHPVRMSLEKTGEAILIGRGDVPLFATTKAASLLGYETAEDLLADTALWQYMKSATQLPVRTSLPLPGGGVIEVSVTSGTIAWLNGPAEQFLLNPLNASLAKARADMPAKPVPVAAQTPASENTVEPVAATSNLQVMEADELKALLDVASDGIIALDESGAILSFSAGAEAIFGMAQADVKGRPFSGLLTPDCHKPMRDYLAALSGTGLASVFNDGREFTAVVKQGGEVPLFVTLGKLRSPPSKAAFCAVVRDITQWKRTERELREAKEAAETESRQKSDFLAGFNHEIRTPLNAILGFSEVMRLERFGEIKNDKYRGYANDIHTSGAHLLALVNDLLDLSKVEAGKLELDFTAVSVADVADHAIRLLQEEASRSGIVVRKSFSPALPRVVADLRALRQVTLNLLSNAIKYSDAGSQVIISVLLDGAGELLLRIKDSGPGMTGSQLKEALEPYARVQATSRGRQGTGLGLPLSKALVEANRAKFEMSSEPGQGTLVEIRFPATRVLAE